MPFKILTYPNSSGWWFGPLWKMMEFVNGKDDIPYMTWKIKHVWNHQPVMVHDVILTLSLACFNARLDLRSGVHLTVRCLPSPRKITIFTGGICLPFPFLGWFMTLFTHIIWFYHIGYPSSKKKTEHLHLWDVGISAAGPSYRAYPDHPTSLRLELGVTKNNGWTLIGPSPDRSDKFHGLEG